MAESKNTLFGTTEEQKKEMKEQADMIGISMSELIRWKVFYPSPMDTAGLFEIKTDIREMRNRLDETTRFLADSLAKLEHSHNNDELIRQLSRIEDDYHQLTDMADKITKSWFDLFDEIKTSNLLSLKEIHDGDGNQSSGSSTKSGSENEDDQDDGRIPYNPDWEKAWGRDR